MATSARPLGSLSLSLDSPSSKPTPLLPPASSFSPSPVKSSTTLSMASSSSGKPEVNKALVGFYFIAWYVLNPEPFNPSTLQPFNPSTLKSFNPSTLQPFNPKP